MAQYIDKAAVVAEIERLKENARMSYSDYADGRLDVCKGLLSFIDTLEVKEVDLEKEINRVWDNTSDYFSEDGWKEFENIAKHFFELGLKTKTWEEERMEECPYRQVGCTMYEGHILECKGVCSWVVDYPTLKRLKAQKGE